MESSHEKQNDFDGLSPLKNDFCPFTTSSQSSNYGHQKEHRPKKFECDACCYKTTRKGDLKRHINDVHHEAKPYKCDVCFYTTSFKSDFTLHKKKPHVTCDICSVVVTQVALKRHKRHMHKELDIMEKKRKEEKLKCDICAHIAISQKGLRLHQKEHGPKEFKCDVCIYKTTSKS